MAGLADKYCQRWNGHVAGAPGSVGQQVHQPHKRDAAEQRMSIDGRKPERFPARAHQPVKRRTEDQQQGCRQRRRQQRENQGGTGELACLLAIPSAKSMTDGSRHAGAKT